MVALLVLPYIALVYLEIIAPYTNHSVSRALLKKYCAAHLALIVFIVAVYIPMAIYLGLLAHFTEKEMIWASRRAASARTPQTREELVAKMEKGQVQIMSL